MLRLKDKRTFITATLILGVAVVLLIFSVFSKPKGQSLDGVGKMDITYVEIDTAGEGEKQKLLGKQITNNIEYSTIPITLGTLTFIAEIADTPQLQQLGLSSRSSLASTSAMLFVFSNAGLHPFWMKDMHFPIDIIWLDENGIVVTVAADVNPDTYPKSFAPTTPSVYVIEVPAGTVFEQKIKIGDRLIFDKNLLKNSSN